MEGRLRLLAAYFFAASSWPSSINRVILRAREFSLATRSNNTADCRSEAPCSIHRASTCLSQPLIFVATSLRLRGVRLRFPDSNQVCRCAWIRSKLASATDVAQYWNNADFPVPLAPTTYNCWPMSTDTASCPLKSLGYIDPSNLPVIPPPAPYRVINLCRSVLNSSSSTARFRRCSPIFRSIESRMEAISSCRSLSGNQMGIVADKLALYTELIDETFLCAVKNPLVLKCVNHRKRYLFNISL